jgi:hypothetical protein
MATRLQAIIDFAYKSGGVEQAQAALGKLSNAGKTVGQSISSGTAQATGALNGLLSTGKALGQAWTDLATPVNQSLEIFQKVGQTAQQAYQFISEGTQLARTQDQFDALAGSIGTTSDMLMGQLRAATRGTVADFDLMTGASSLVSLGLTNTAEDTVRLTKLIGQLGWDMNQVTLTLANQSTMRLDALGLSVSDVEGRVDALKAAGMAADEAFKFAIIEAGEEKLNLLGDAADTAAGKLKILETNAKNFGDSFKRTFGENFVNNLNAAADGIFETEESASSLGETLANVATNVSFLGFIRLVKEGVADLGEESRNAEGRISGMGGVVQQLPPLLDNAAAGVKRFGDETKISRQSIIDATAATDGWMASMNTVTTLTAQAARERAAEATANYQASDAYGELQDKVFQTNQTYDMWAYGLRATNLELQNQANTIPTVTGAVYASSEAVAEYNRQLGEYYITAQETDDANLLLNSGIRQTSGGLREVSNLTEQQTEDLARMQGAYDKAAQTIRDYELGVKGANLSDEERAEKIEELRGQMSLLEGNMEQLNAAGVSYIEVAGGMVGFGPAVVDAFTQSASAMGANATQLAAIQMAFSDLQPAQAEAILKEAALRAEIERLTQEILNNNMTVYEARDAYIAFQNGLNDMTISVNEGTGSVILLDDSMISASNSTQTLLDKFGAFPDEVGTTVNVDTTEAENRISSLEARLAGLGSGGAPATASGGYQAGPDLPGQGHATGADFIVPPGYPNDSYPMRVQSGEHVTVTPAGQTRGGDTYNLYVTAMDGGANVRREINYLKALAGA